jgi:hypothetical protein
MSMMSPLLVLIPLSILAAVVLVESLVAMRVKSLIAGMILPLAFGAVSLYYLFFFHEERPTMKPGMYGTFYLVCCLVSLVTLIVVKLVSKRKSHSSL